MTRFSRASRAGLVLGLFSIFLPQNLPAWGDAGHRMIGLAAAQKLPADMPAFFRAASAQLAYLNPEPDRWKDRAERSMDPALSGGTSPEHFADMDLVAPAVLAGALAAPDRFAYADTLRAAGVAVSNFGVLPFTILELAQKLRGDFRLWRIAPDSTVRAWAEARIIDDAGILGHYIADGSNPLHTTKHFNGWTGNNPNAYTTSNRIHSQFESAYVQAHLRLPDVLAEVPTAAQVHPDLRRAVVAYLHESATHVERLYAMEKAVTFAPETTTAEQKAFASARLAAGAAMLRDIWYTAWVTSAQRPPVPPR